MSQEYKMYNVRSIDNIKVMYFYADGQKEVKNPWNMKRPCIVQE